MVVTANFTRLARTLASGMGLPSLPIVSLRADLEHLSDEEVLKEAETMIADFESALRVGATSAASHPIGPR